VHVTRPAAVLFDIGDTLLREVRFDLAAGIRAALPARLRASASELAHSFRNELDVAHVIRREPMLSRWLCAHVADLRDMEEDRVEDTVWAEVVTLIPTRGARELLDRLHADGVKTGAISNAYTPTAQTSQSERTRAPALAGALVRDKSRDKACSEHFRTCRRHATRYAPQLSELI
jgi:FMN phosphatase YigB (HAD superfamily)